MNKMLLGALAAVGLGAATAGVVVMAGIVDVGADTPHSSFTYQALTFARERAIASRTGDIQVPADQFAPAQPGACSDIDKDARHSKQPMPRQMHQQRCPSLH